MSKLSGMRDSTSELGKSNSETSKEVLQEMGKVSREGRITQKTCRGARAHALGECNHSSGGTCFFKFALVPNTNPAKSEGDIVNQDIEMGPMAMCFDLIQGWTSSKLGPKSGHWKRLAREMKPNMSTGDSGPKCRKHEGLNPLK